MYGNHLGVYMVLWVEVQILWRRHLCLQEKLYSCPAILYLRKSLEEEREAVCDFLFAFLDEILSPLQEAFLDSRSYPWCADLWEISNHLAEQRKVHDRPFISTSSLSPHPSPTNPSLLQLQPCLILPT